MCGMCVECTDQASFLDPSKSLHDTDRLLYPLFGLQFAGAWVQRRKVSVSAQPVLDRNRKRETKRDEAIS